METNCNKPKPPGLVRRLETLGASALTEAELLAVVVSSRETVAWARLLEQQPRGLRLLVRMSARELARELGTGTARAARLEAAFELGRRAQLTASTLRPRFVNSRQIFQFVEPALRDIEQEAFEVLAVDARNRLVRRQRISLGTLTGSLVHPREVFRAAVKSGACALVLVHNHPSGDPSPSPEDLQVTDRLRRAGELLGIRVLDHIIVGDGRYVSLADRGLMTASL